MTPTGGKSGQIRPRSHGILQQQTSGNSIRIWRLNDQDSGRDAGGVKGVVMANVVVEPYLSPTAASGTVDDISKMV